LDGVRLEHDRQASSLAATSSSVIVEVTADTSALM
jgi:hypothetical protein